MEKNDFFSAEHPEVHEQCVGLRLEDPYEEVREGPENMEEKKEDHKELEEMLRAEDDLVRFSANSLVPDLRHLVAGFCLELEFSQLQIIDFVTLR